MKSFSFGWQYAAFGKVTKGLDVLDKLEKVKAIDNNGLVEASQQPVINSIKILD